MQLQLQRRVSQPRDNIIYTPLWRFENFCYHLFPCLFKVLEPASKAFLTTTVTSIAITVALDAVSCSSYMGFLLLCKW
jgi:hypothetical protein